MIALAYARASDTAEHPPKSKDSWIAHVIFVELKEIAS